MGHPTAWRYRWSSSLFVFVVGSGIRPIPSPGGVNSIPTIVILGDRTIRICIGILPLPPLYRPLHLILLLALHVHPLLALRIILSAPRQRSCRRVVRDDRLSVLV